MTPPKISERDFHKQVAAYLARVLPDSVPWTTIGHGGGGKVRGAQLKAMGLQPGWPDIILLHCGRFLALELKSKDGDVRPQQRAVHAQIARAGGAVKIARTLEEIEDFLIVSGIDVRARVTA